MNMAKITLVAFAVAIASSFAQAGDTTLSPYYSQDGSYGVGIKTTFGGSTKRVMREEEPMQLADASDAVSKAAAQMPTDSNVEIDGLKVHRSVFDCKRAVRNGTAQGYEPTDLSGYGTKPVTEASGRRLGDDRRWACDYMTIEGKKKGTYGKAWVSIAPGSTFRFNPGESNPYALHECGNTIHAHAWVEGVSASSEQFRTATQSQVIINNHIYTGGASNGHFGGMVKGEDKKCGGWCKAGWIIGGIVVGGAIIAAVSDDDDKKGGTPPQGVTLPTGNPPSGNTLPPTGTPPSGNTGGGTAPGGNTTGGSAPSGTTTGGSAPSGVTEVAPGGTTIGGSAPSGATTGGSAPGGSTF